MVGDEQRGAGLVVLYSQGVELCGVGVIRQPYLDESRECFVIVSVQVKLSGRHDGDVVGECAHDGVPHVSSRIAAQNRSSLTRNSNDVFAILQFVLEHDPVTVKCIDFFQLVGIIAEKDRKSPETVGAIWVTYRQQESGLSPVCD